MARRPHLFEHATRALGERRSPSRLALYAIAALAALVVAGGATTAGRAQAISDQGANTVRAINGAPNYGPNTSVPLNGSFVGLAALKSGAGYWVVARDGGVFARGTARFFGSMGGKHLNKPIVGMTATPKGDGYWLVASDGGVFAFGAAGYKGSLGSQKHLNAPITAIASTRSGRGYWMLGSDGGIFSFGDAGFYGSAVNKPHRAPFLAMAATPASRGYYLLGADGGVFTFGNARFAGSAVDGHLATGISVLRNGGYKIARSDGSVRGFGGEPSVAAPADPTAMVHPVIAIASRGSGGSWLARGYSPPPPPKPKPVEVDLSQDPFLKCTRAHESDSAGGYRAVSPGGMYRGAYQFLPSTWSSVARHIGRYDLVGVDPAAASPHDQDVIAMALFQWQGYAPWGNRCRGLR